MLCGAVLHGAVLMLIIDCRNLIGDSIYLVKPLKRFLASKGDGEVALGIDSGLGGEIVRRSFPGLRVDSIDVLEAAWPDVPRMKLSARSAFEETRSDNGHISQGYARILGIEPLPGIEPDVAWLPPPEPQPRQEYIVLAPFSVSCARHRGEVPNKTLSDKDWEPLLEIIRGYGLPLRIVGVPTERLSAGKFGFSEPDYFSARGIEDLVAFLRRSRLVIGVDTGICHVSSCAGIPTVVLWSSAASLRFIGETWAPRTRLVQIGTPAAFDAYRVEGLLEDAVKDLLGWQAPSPSTEVLEPLVRAVFPALDSPAFIPRRYAARGLGDWSGHLPFARDAVASLRPRLLVEIGTNEGESYFGFCQAVEEAGCRCSCYAVSTWHGDLHSPAYGDKVHSEVERYNAERYSSFSHLLRTTPDDALAWFPERSIDLLHIGGPHTYEAVKHDFEAWYPKVSPGGMMLLHGIGVGSADFCARQLWEEISQAHEAFEFHHSHGLGIIRKHGPRRGTAGILDYLFAGGNAEPIRRHYLLCADRLEAKAKLAAAEAAASVPNGGDGIPGRAPVYVDPEDQVIHTLTGCAAAGSVEGDFIELPLADPNLSRTDWTPVEGKPGTWRASTRDPGIVCRAGFDAAAMRFFVVVMSCLCEEPQPEAQLFWSGEDRGGFNERFSIRFPVLADGRAHAYVVDLHTGADPGSLNCLWWHGGSIDFVRFDPLDLPGEFAILAAGFAHQDRIEARGIREALGLLPLRTELSYRYARGSGIEIGALQNPLPLRPDAHIRYADKLTLAQARAHYPELGSAPLVEAEIICDAASLHPVAERTVDFVIANHVLEHLTDPLASLGEWLRVLRCGGHIYVAVPEHTNPLDRLRSVTGLDHLVDDFRYRAERQELDREHYREWVAGTRPELSGEQRAQYEAELVSQRYNIHFHTFSRETFAGLLQVAQEYFPAELVEFRRTYGTSSNEFIAILRKR